MMQLPLGRLLLLVTPHTPGPTQSEPWALVDAQVNYVPNWDIMQGDILIEPDLFRAFMNVAFPPTEHLRHSQAS